ncbi:unnamed protein product [Urochloa decumbens]|uniref:F-box domain-containing protein n=1 Tax=Urochloa decumbens TaxID=240449 RepID=A0ABC8WK66_9POAL
MSPAIRRRRLGSAAGAAAATSMGSGLSVRRTSMKRARAAGLHAEADGLCLDDEVLVTILSLVSGNTADLVRCAAACRRLRRLVSTNAAIICSHPKRLIRFFHLNDMAATSTAAPPRPLWLGQPLFGGLVRGFGHRMFNASSRVVASRDGLLAAEICRRRTVLRLCVCHPATGEADHLPPLRGRDCPGPYACALLAADDLLHFQQDGTRSAASYRLLLVYSRRSFTAARCFSSDAGSWGPEARVSGARVASALLHATHTAIVHRGVVFWPRLRFALLALPAVNATVVVNGLTTPFLYGQDKSMLGLMPDGKLCWAEVIGRDKISVSFRSHGGDMFCLHDGTLNGCWGRYWTINLANSMPELSAATSVTLRWFYEKSSTLFFTASCIGHGDDGGEECCYTLNFSTHEIDKVLRNGDNDEPWGDMYGYELDREKFLGSLGERDGGTQGSF